jgi:hypothetical protein
MYVRKWLIVVFTAGLIAGCGGGNSGTTGTTEGSGASQSGDRAAAESSGGSTPELVYRGCLDAIRGTTAKKIARSACVEARDAFAKCRAAGPCGRLLTQCTAQAKSAPTGSATDARLKACKVAADRVEATLKSPP